MRAGCPRLADDVCTFIRQHTFDLAVIGLAVSSGPGDR